MKWLNREKDTTPKPQNEYEVQIIRTPNESNRYRVKIYLGDKDLTDWAMDLWKNTTADTKLGAIWVAHSIIKAYEKEQLPDTVVAETLIRTKKK